MKALFVVTEAMGKALVMSFALIWFVPSNICAVKAIFTKVELNGTGLGAGFWVE